MSIAKPLSATTGRDRDSSETAQEEVFVVDKKGPNLTRALPCQ